MIQEYFIIHYHGGYLGINPALSMTYWAEYDSQAYKFSTLEEAKAIMASKDGCTKITKYTVSTVIEDIEL